MGAFFLTKSIFGVIITGRFTLNYLEDIAVNIRSLLIVLSIGFFSVGAPAANANEAQQNAGQIYAELQAANCKLHNDATPFNVTLENIQLMVLCRKSNPSFQKKIKPLHVDMALMKEDYNDVIIALRKVGVYIN